MDNNDLIDLGPKITQLKKTLLKNKFKILLSGLISCSIGLFIIWFIGPSYTAQMTFVAENDKSSKAGGYASIAAQFGIDIGMGGGNIFDGDNLVEFFKSRKMIDETLLSPSGLKDKLLIDWYIDIYKLKKKWQSDKELSNINFNSLNKQNYTRKHDSIINIVAEKIIKKRIDVDKIDKKMDITYLKMQSKNQEFAKKFIETLAENAIVFYANYKTKKSKANVDLLQHQTDSVRNELFSGIGQVANQNDMNVNPLKQKLRVNTQKTQVNLQVSTAVYTELTKNLELAKLTLMKEAPLIQIIDKPRLPLKDDMVEFKLVAIFSFLGGIILVLLLITYYVLVLKK